MLSAPTVEIPPTEPVIDLEQVKTYLRVDGSELDVEIGALIDAAVEDIESVTGLRLAPQTVRVSADSFSDLAHLQVGPVTEVAQIDYLSVYGDAQTLDADSYELAGAGLERSIRPAFGETWPAASSIEGSISVTLEVGYEELPGDLRFALLQAVRAKFEGSAADLFALTVNKRIWL